MSKVSASLIFEPKRVLAAFKMMSAEVRARMVKQVKASTANVTRGAKLRVPVSGPNSRKAKGRLAAGELRNTIRDEYAEDGLTGFVKAGYGKLSRRTVRGTKPKNQRVQNAAQFMRSQHTTALRMNNAMDRAAGIYAMVQEYGSPGRGLAAQPFLRPAQEAELPALRKGVGDALRGAIDASRQTGGTA